MRRGRSAQALVPFADMLGGAGGMVVVGKAVVGKRPAAYADPRRYQSATLTKSVDQTD